MIDGVAAAVAEVAEFRVDCVMSCYEASGNPQGCSLYNAGMGNATATGTCA